jgi:mono/diheme cytochrome c family protein
MEHENENDRGFKCSPRWRRSPSCAFSHCPHKAQSAPETLYKGKCAACHGADGAGSAMGTKMGTHDFTTAAAQGMSDAELTDTITNGKNKMPKYGTSLKPEDIKGLVAYIRTLKK